MVSALCHHTAPKTCCPLFLVNRAKDWAGMLQPRQGGREDTSNHANDLFSPPFFFPPPSLFSFVLLEFIFLIFCFYSKALFIYLMYTAKLGEKGV